MFIYTHVLLHMFLYAYSSAHSALKASPMASPLVGMFSKSLPRQGGLRMSTPSQLFALLPCELGQERPFQLGLQSLGLAQALKELPPFLCDYGMSQNKLAC